LTFRHITKYVAGVLRDFMHLTKALADPSRVRVLLALQAGELCVCQISELLGLAPSTVSKHLSILHHAGLIESRKTERWVYCRLPGPAAPPPVRQALAWVRSSLAHAPEAEADRLQLQRILRIEPTTLCKRQGRK
jgi:DNA-binding transcriptional ArsR family regulator